MSLGHGASIVRDGLVLHLDAANVKSYSGSGSTWYDMSSYRASGNILNDASYVSSDGGYFTLDGVDDKVVLENTDHLAFTDETFSVCFFARQNPSITQVNGRLISKGLFNTEGYEIFIDTDSMTFRTYNNASYSSHDLSLTSVDHSSWKYYAIMKDSSSTSKIHIYPDQLISSGGASDCSFTDRDFTIGMRSGFSDYVFGGDVSDIKVYNKALTDAEIQQNFEALRGRYGI